MRPRLRRRSGWLVCRGWRECGAALVAYSGGKIIRGPQTAGLLVGRRDLVRAAWANSSPHHAFGRAAKVSKEEIVGMLRAVGVWRSGRDIQADFREWESWCRHIIRPVAMKPGEYRIVARRLYEILSSAPGPAKPQDQPAGFGPGEAGCQTNLAMLLTERNFLVSTPLHFGPGNARCYNKRVRNPDGRIERKDCPLHGNSREDSGRTAADVARR